MYVNNTIKVTFSRTFAAVGAGVAISTTAPTPCHAAFGGGGAGTFAVHSGTDREKFTLDLTPPSLAPTTAGPAKPSSASAVQAVFLMPLVLALF